MWKIFWKSTKIKRGKKRPYREHKSLACLRWLKKNSLKIELDNWAFATNLNFLIYIFATRLNFTRIGSFIWWTVPFCFILKDGLVLRYIKLLIEQNSQLKISKHYDIGLQRYRDEKISVCGKISIGLIN